VQTDLKIGLPQGCYGRIGMILITVNKAYAMYFLLSLNTLLWKLLDG